MTHLDSCGSQPCNTSVKAVATEIGRVFLRLRQFLVYMQEQAVPGEMPRTFGNHPPCMRARKRAGKMLKRADFV